MTTIHLDWPEKELWPNSRVHWAVLAECREYQKFCAAVTCIDAGLENYPFDTSALTLDMTFHPPDKRKRDLDNMLAAMKAAIDGIAETIGVDDSMFSISLSRGEIAKGGRVSISIKPTSSRRAA